MTYVPAYLGNVSNLACPQEGGDALVMSDPDRYASILTEVQEVEQFPVTARKSGLWSIDVTVKGDGPLERITSLNHPVSIVTTPTKLDAVVSLKPTVDRSLVPNHDFVLYVRDAGISKPSAISTMTPSRQQAIRRAG